MEKQLLISSRKSKVKNRGRKPERWKNGGPKIRVKNRVSKREGLIIEGDSYLLYLYTISYRERRPTSQRALIH